MEKRKGDKECNNDDCKNRTYGRLCKPCELERRAANRISDRRKHNRFRTTQKNTM
jgi:hypothetical protein